MEEQSNITFRVIKQGIMANANFTVLVNGKSVGKINFKKELTLPFQKGIQKIQFKVGFMTTKELQVNVDGNDKIIEWIYGNNTEPYIVGEENTKIKNTADKSLNDLNENNQSLNSKKAKKPKNVLIIMLVIIIGIVGGISLSNVFDDTYNTNTQKETLDQYAGLWVHYSPHTTGAEMTLTLDGKGNFTEKTTVSEYNRTLVYNGTYKIENDTITLYKDGSVHSKWEIVNNKLLRNADSRTLTEYRKK